MKILSHEERDDGMMVYQTDFALMPVFVYPADKFINLAALEKEMDKKAQEVTIRKQRRDSRVAGLKDELDAQLGVKP